MKRFEWLVVIETVLVAASPLAIPLINGPGTTLVLVLMMLTSFVASSLDNRPLALFAAWLLGIGLFLLPTIGVYLATRRNNRGVGMAIISSWTIYYIMCVLFWFPPRGFP